MTKAFNDYEKAIDEIKELIDVFDDINSQHPNQAPRVLKRATLIMILTAWETYVEDVVEELLQKKLASLNDSLVSKIINRSFEKTTKRFNTPDSLNTKHLFEDFLGVDVTENWVWNNFDQETSRAKLNEWVRKRGDAVHRMSVDHQEADIATKDDLRRCLSFFNELVKATESALIKT